MFVLCNIIGQVIEWNSCLYLCFVDFETEAFDSVHRETLWHLLKSYGIPTKLVNMVRAMYKNCRCAVMDETGHLEWFEVLSGVRQGCVISGFLFLIVIDWVIGTVENNRNGIRWKLTTTLDDLDFADDLALLSSRWSQAQDKLNRLSQFGGKVGLKINIDKTKVLRYNPGRLDPLTIRERNVEDVESFVYLGAKVDKQGGAASDIRARTVKARAAFNKLNKLLSRKTKITIFKTNVVAVLLYGCETWRMTKEDEYKLNVFQHKCLRKILKFY